MKNLKEPSENHEVTFENKDFEIFSTMINMNLFEQAVKDSPFKKHIKSKYHQFSSKILTNRFIDSVKNNSVIYSRSKLDSFKFNYYFGKKDID